ncbi:ATP-binding protein [Ruegeria sp. HKCCD7318]|uniref:hybrid sensor histidine kinase/response regulator n=1 Tax=Ruegeria sp. HKCCD7318 TaxID=2683014 RepID=UPI001491862E|nr:ATP-binding protein [Ruegeria sp. HKCCD7318]NOE34494.1 response regulator [Ruegeria sp. HKCCD7318]
MQDKLARILIPASVLFLVALVVALGRNLWLEQRALSTAGNENAQWTILQLDTEFANLRSVLLEESSSLSPHSARIDIQTQIALSRIDLVSEGVAREIIESDNRATELLQQLHHFAEEATKLTQSDSLPAVVDELFNLTTLYKPVARELSLLGVSIGAERTEARRQVFSSALRNAGVIATSVVILLAAVLLFLYQMLRISRKRDLALRETTARLESTVSASLDAIVIGNEKGEIVEFNQAAERVFGSKKKEVLGKKIEGTILPAVPSKESNEADNTELPNLFSGFSENKRVEIIGTRRNGEEFPAEVNVIRVSKAGNALVAVYLRDISERKRNERALLEAKENAERTDRAKSRFLEIMSHEMRTPITGILGVLDLLKTTDLTEKQSHFLEVAIASGEILLKQVNEALDITRIESGSLVLSPAKFNPHNKISQAIAVLEPLAMAKGLKLKTDLDPDLFGYFIADELRVGQIVTNLVGNAIKFTSVGSVNVQLRGNISQQITDLILTVSDTGDGIPENQFEKVFEDYVTLALDKGRLPRGDGLGLPISRKIARMMGGDITVCSQLGRGSHFTLTIPMKKASESPRNGPKVDRLNLVRSAPSVQKLSVLVVEDNAVNNSVLCEMLSSLGHNVQSALSGDEGYELAISTKHDVILMDIGLPDTDGCKLTERIRMSGGPNKTSRIHGLSAYDEGEYLKNALKSGMDGFSTKPIRLRDLQKVLLGEPLVSDPVRGDASLIDTKILQELGDTLGQAQMENALREFFEEMFNFCVEHEMLSDLNERGELASHLHKLSGAAALFGFRSLTKVIEHTRKQAVEADINSLEIDLSRLKQETEETRRRMEKLDFTKKTDTSRRYIS